MIKSIGKILVIILALYGFLNLISLAFPGLKNILLHPKVVNTPAVKGAIDYANQILSESNQIRIPEYSPPSGSDKSVVDTITEKINKKVSDTASKAVDNVKAQASDQVCKALYQKLESECGQPDQPEE